MPRGKDRFAQEYLGRPICDENYRKIFGADIDIERFNKSERHILDQEFAIDVQITLKPSLLIFTGQEKFLSHEYANFQTLTVERMQNPREDECGDWCNLAAQFYFCGYFTKDLEPIIKELRTLGPQPQVFEKRYEELMRGVQLNPWIMVNWASLVWATHAGLINWQERGNDKSSARASFKYVPMNEIPSGCIIAGEYDSTRS